MMAEPKLLAVDQPALPAAQFFRPFGLPFGEIAPDICLTLELHQSERQVDNYLRWLMQMSPWPLTEGIGVD